MPDTVTAPRILDRGVMWLTVACPCGARLTVSLADGRRRCARCGTGYRYVAATVEVSD